MDIYGTTLSGIFKEFAKQVFVRTPKFAFLDIPKYMFFGTRELLGFGVYHPKGGEAKFKQDIAPF